MWDTFGGIGLSMRDGWKEEPSKWNGRNRGGINTVKREFMEGRGL